jgi:hypothetical protein
VARVAGDPIEAEQGILGLLMLTARRLVGISSAVRLN